MYAEIFEKMWNNGLEVLTAKVINSKYMYLNVITQIQHKMSHKTLICKMSTFFKSIIIIICYNSTFLIRNVRAKMSQIFKDGTLPLYSYHNI